MIATEHRAIGRRSRSLAQLERDAALERVGRARRGLIIGAAALTAAIAALVSAIAPGHTLGQARILTGAQTSAAAAATVTQMPPLASPSQLGLQGPSQAPQSAPSQATPNPAAAAPAPAPAPAVSGGS